MKNIGIYIHIPFCKQKCKYCDFVSFKCVEEQADRYFKCLEMEINEKIKELKNEIKKDSVGGSYFDDIEVDTIYIGGGTPSIVNEGFIENTLKLLLSNFNVSKKAEITIEVNPGTVNKEKLKKYLDVGINRLSIGLQSTSDDLLKMLGRIHTYKDFEEVYDMARETGFNNINVDLMIGLPNQTMEDVEDSLSKIIEKSPEHISVYSLIVEEGTQMCDLIDNGKLKLPSEDLERNMYWMVKKTLENNGYNHYEISNFAKESHESKHNMNCWKQHEYLGFGLAAHSYFDGIRYSNIDNLKQYIQNWEDNESVYNIVFHEKQSKDEMMKEFMLLGLRKISGVSVSEFKQKFVDNPLYIFRNELKKLVEEELVEVEDDSIRLTDKGIDLANQIWMEFV